MSAQEPKYEFRDGHVFNRASGEMIPDDEPVMVFRGRDIYALRILYAYLSLVQNGEHYQAVSNRIDDFEKFAATHYDRMKEPDTDLGGSNAHSR